MSQTLISAILRRMSSRVRTGTSSDPYTAADIAAAGNPAGAAGDGDALITAFDGDSSLSPNINIVEREIVPVPVVPVNLPTEYTVSPATLVAPAVNPPNG